MGGVPTSRRSPEELHQIACIAADGNRDNASMCAGDAMRIEKQALRHKGKKLLADSFQKPVAQLDFVNSLILGNFVFA